MSGRFLTLAGVADLLGVNLSLVYRWSSEDPTFPKSKLGAKTIRVDSEKLREWIEKRTAGAGNYEI